MGVDFVKPDDKAAANGQPGGYDIEYTNPAVDDTPAPKRKTSLLNWLTQPKASQSSKKAVAAQPVTLPSTQTARAAAPVGATQQNQPAKPPTDKAYAITEHQPTPAASNTVTLSPVVATGKSSAKSTAPMAVSPVEFHQVGRVLPPPPPPPRPLRSTTKTESGQAGSAVQSTSSAKIPITTIQSARPAPASTTPPVPMTPRAPVAPTVPVMPKPPLPTAPIPGAPTAPARVLPMAPRPTAPAVASVPPVPSAPAAKNPSAPRSGRAPSAPAGATVSTDGSVAGPVVIARNVSGMHGDATNPEAITATGLNVNLLPGYAAAAMRGLAAPLRLLRFTVGSVVCFTLVYAAMVGYEAYFIYRTEIGQQHLQELNTQILKYTDLQKEISATNDTLIALNDLLQGHIYWSNWFNFLEAYTLPNVYFTDLSANQTGVVNLEGVTKDYTTITQQVNALRAASAVVQSVEVSTATRSLVESDATVTAETTAAAADQTSTEETSTADSSVATQDSLVHFSLSLHINPEVLFYSSDYYSYEQAP